MAYDKEIIQKAENLYVVQKLSYQKIAKQLNISRWQTILRWSRKYNWTKKEIKIEQESDNIAEEELIAKLAKTKSKYKVENVEILDGSKALCGNALVKLKTVFLADKDNKLVVDSKFMKIMANMIYVMNDVIGKQDEVLFGRNRIDLSGDLNINADEIIKATIDYLDTCPEEHDLDIQPDKVKAKK